MGVHTHADALLHVHTCALTRSPGAAPHPAPPCPALQVLSASEEEEDDDGDARKEAVRSLHPSIGIRRSKLWGFPTLLGGTRTVVLPAQRVPGASVCPTPPCPPCPPAPGFMLHTGSGQSDSSGFVEEPVAGQPPAAQVHGTDQTA